MMKRYVKKFSISMLVAVMAFSFTLLAYFLTTKSIQQKKTLEFKNLSYEVVQSVSSRMQTYVNALVQTRSMFYVTDEVDRLEFYHYINNLNLLKQYPGILGIGYSERILKKDLPVHLAKIRGEGFKNYKIWPAYDRPEYYSIVYLEPFDWRNQKAFGFDMYTDPTRKEAMNGARDSGNPYLTRRVILVQEGSKDIQYGFLIYVPFYDSVELKPTLEERRKSLKGFIYSPFRTLDLFKDILGPIQNENIGVEVYIGGSTEDDLIYRSPNLSDEIKKLNPHTSEIDIASRKWFIKTFPMPGKGQDLAPFLMLVLGSLFSISLFWIVWRHQKYNREERERAKVYETLTKVGKNLSAELNLEKLCQSAVEAVISLTQADLGALFYKIQNERGEEIVQSAFGGIPPDKQSLLTDKKMLQDIEALKNEEVLKESSFFRLFTEQLGLKNFRALRLESRTHEVLGWLFLGQTKTRYFNKREEILVEGIISQAVIAFEKAKLHKQLTEALAARDELLSIASHELKTPITSMKLQFQLAQKMIEKNDERVFDRELVKKRIILAANQLERMSKLVNDMIRPSGFFSTKIELNKEEVNVNDLIQFVIDSLQEQLNQLKIELTFKSKTRDGRVYGDKNRLEQVLNNLITNAMKYGRNNPIEVRTQFEEDYVVISVEDFGMGIPPDSISRIFERYERVGDNENIQGLGLGLFITKEIIEAHEGTIWVESQEGHGSTFFVKLPRIRGAV